VRHRIAVKLSFAHAEGRNYRQLPARRGCVRSRRCRVVQGWPASSRKIVPVDQGILDWSKIFNAAKTGMSWRPKQEW
jgi:hypothetical protein